MTISYVTLSKNTEEFPTGQESTNFSFPMPAEVVPGDVLIINVTTSTQALSSGLTGTSSGLTPIIPLSSGAAVGVSGALYWYEVPAVKPASVDFTWNVARRGSIAWVALHSSVGAMSIDGVATGSWTLPTTTSHIGGDITTTAPNTYILGGVMYGSGSATTGVPTGWTLRTNTTQREGTIATKGLQAVAGPTGTVVFDTTSSGSYEGRAWQLAVKEAGASGLVVTGAVTTAGYPSFTGDVADGAAIVFDNVNPANSVIIGTNKAVGGGLHVFNLSGTQLSSKLDGAANSVDYRDMSSVAGWEDRILILTSDRDASLLRYYWMNRTTKALTLAGTTALGWEPYGTCLYVHSDGAVYAFVSQRGPDDTSPRNFYQYPLTRSSETVTAGAAVRTINVSSVVEGMAADDLTGYLFVSEEDVGLYRYSAAPTGGTSRVAVDTVGAGNLVADVEDVAIARNKDGNWLLVSSQGDNTYHVYDMDTFAHVKKFTVNRPGGSNQVTGTDGLDVYLGNFNDNFPNGIIVVHDGDQTPISDFVLADSGPVFGTPAVVPAEVAGSSTASLLIPSGRWNKATMKATWWNSTTSTWQGLIPTSTGHREYANLASPVAGDIFDGSQSSRVSTVTLPNGIGVATVKASGSDYSAASFTGTVLQTSVPFPIAVADLDQSPVSIVRSPNGYLWAAALYSNTVKLTRSTDGGATWSALTDIGTFASFPTGVAGLAVSGTKVILLASGNDGSGRIAMSIDQTSAGVTAASWTTETLPALPGGTLSDDHLGITTAADGTVLAALKTTNAGANLQLIYVLARNTSGTWTQYAVETGPDDNGGGAAGYSRPSIFVVGDNVYVIYGSIYAPNNLSYKTAKLYNLSVWGGRQTLFTTGDWSDGAVVPRSSDIRTANTAFPVLANNRASSVVASAWIEVDAVDPGVLKMYLGSVQINSFGVVSRIYAGSTLVWGTV